MGEWPTEGPAGHQDVLRSLHAELTECRKQSARIVHDLREREKELSCFYAVASLLQQTHLTLAETLRALVAALKAAYQFPEVTCARVWVEGELHQTENFCQSPWRQTSPLRTGGSTMGAIEVYYLEERPPAEEGPFLAEERRLLDSVANQLVLHLLERRERSELQATVKLYQQEAAELDLFYRTAPVGLCVLDTELRYVRVNERLAEANGAPVHAHYGKTMREVAPDVAARMEPFLRHVIASGKPVLDVEFNAEKAARPGLARHWLSHASPITRADGTTYGVSLVVEEVSERMWLQEARQREQEFRKLAENSTDVVVRVDRSLRHIYVNPATEVVFGRPRSELLNRTTLEVGLAPETADFINDHVRRAFNTGQTQAIEVRLAATGGQRVLDARLVPELDTEGQVVTVLGIGRDITDLKRAQFELERLSLHDHMTGIANRRYLDQFLEREWGREVRHHHPVAIIMADIDHFKNYNDYYGHQRGDDCLREVAQTLKTHLRRPTDFLVRYGGEEFAIVLLETDLEPARLIAEKLRSAVAERRLPHEASPVSTVVTASFGVSSRMAHLTTFSALLSDADKALYLAKAKGRNRVALARNPVQ